MNRRLAVIAATIITVVVAVGAIASGFTSRTSGSNAGGSSGAAAAGGAPVIIKEFDFNPKSITVAVGGSVTWTNQDGFDHSIKSANGSFNSPDLGTGKTFSAKFDTAGTFAYVCGIHNFMTGTVVVTK